MTTFRNILIEVVNTFAHKQPRTGDTAAMLDDIRMVEPLPSDIFTRFELVVRQAEADIAYAMGISYDQLSHDYDRGTI